MTGTLYGAASPKGWQLRLDYTTTEDVSANRSTVTGDLYVYDGTGRSYNETTGEPWYDICGGGRNYFTYSYTAIGWYYLGTRTFTADHNGDGSGSVTLTGDWCSGISDSSYTPYSLSVSGTVTLPTIPRASALSCGSFTLGAAGSIHISAASGDFRHTVTYTFGGVSGTVVSGAKDGNISWMPPLTLCAQIPSATAGTGTLTCTTYSGGTAIGTASCSFTAYVPPSVVPSITGFTVSPSNSLSALSGVYVKGFTKVSYAVTAAGQYGASVTGCTVSFGGVSGSGMGGTTGVLTAAGAVTPTVTVYDSRGRTSTKKLGAVTVYDYAPPTVSGFSANRCTADGVLSDSGTYLRVTISAGCSSVGGRNAVAVRARYRVSGGSFGGYTAISGSAVIGGDLTVNRSYVLEATVTDTLGGSKTMTESIPTSAVTVNFRDGGKGVAVGKYSEKAAFECALPAEFTDGVKIGDALVADFAVNYGCPHYIAWEKTKSGVLHCWLNNTVTLTGSTPKALMGGYVSYVEIEMPISCTDVGWTGVASGRLGTGYGFALVVGRSNNTIRVYILGNQNSNSIELTGLCVFGHWK